MKSEKNTKSEKKGHSNRRRIAQPSEFESQITLQLDQFFRYFNYYYPGKNKEEIINQCITGNAYWITLDSQYFPDLVHLEMGKIEQLRRKTALKNGAYPPTKDSLEEEKFILRTRRILSQHFECHQQQDARRYPMTPLISHYETLLSSHEETVSQQLRLTNHSLENHKHQNEAALTKLGIPLVKSARLFAYQKLEKEVIDQLVRKAKEKDEQPRCDFCFTRDKDIIKCKSCDLHVHPLCFAKAKSCEDFYCDQCVHSIPQSAQCELCPLQGGRFLELEDKVPIISFQLSKGENNLKFKMVRVQQQGKKRQFIHISCFVLHPECSYSVSKNKVEGFHYIDRSKKNMSICMICGNMIGLTVPCTNQSCRRAYHPECAQRNNLKINVIKANNKSLLEIYCERHKKPESYEYLNESVSNRIKDLKRFYQSLDHEIKRHGNNHTQSRQKRQTKAEENLKADLCLACSEENTFESQIVNCRKCYGWRHSACSHVCPLCQP